MFSRVSRRSCKHPHERPAKLRSEHSIQVPQTCDCLLHFLQELLCRQVHQHTSAAGNNAHLLTRAALWAGSSNLISVKMLFSFRRNERAEPACGDIARRAARNRTAAAAFSYLLYAKNAIHYTPVNDDFRRLQHVSTPSSGQTLRFSSLWVEISL